MTDAESPVLVFGGTFDPPHRRHVDMATEAADLLGAREILVIPAALNPQRTASPPAPPEDRLHLVRLAFRDEPRARVLDIEVRRGPPSYTIDTVRKLVALGHRPLRLLIGSDQALNLPSWKEWKTVVALAPPAIVLRPPHTLATFPGMLAARFDDPGRWGSRVLAMEPVGASSTSIREGLANGSADPLSTTELDEEVGRAIRERLLYRRH